MSYNRITGACSDHPAAIALWGAPRTVDALAAAGAEREREDDASRLIHGGTNLRLGPATWRARSVARVGVGFFRHGETTEFTGATGGVGRYLRMRSRFLGLFTSGVSFTADYWSVDETTFVVAHAGLYFRIG